MVDEYDDLRERYENDDSTGQPPELEWEDNTDLYLLVVTWCDQHDIAMSEQQLAVLVDNETGGMMLSNTTGTPQDNPSGTNSR